MSYLALYRKYRPISFDDFVGQSEVASVIRNEILNDKVSHAYLFSGPRGTGKTSTAKIIARMLNCTNLSSDGIPCCGCDSCRNFNNNSDIVEIDAASNNGVDEIRELKDKVNLVPTFGKYKIYIIDEVHMLTTQAFNALLKTLEEPPNHVIFILATTEFYKIPATIVSRCQKFQFLKFSLNDIVLKLKEISKLENINVNDDILFEIARLSDGGLRDAINMLDQLSSFKSDGFIVDDVYKLNGVVSFLDFKNLLNYVYLNDIVAIVDFFENLDKYGKNFEKFIGDLIELLKDLLIYKKTNELNFNVTDKNEVIKFLGDLYSFEKIYELIIVMNDVLNKIKNSSFVKILLISEFINFSNKFKQNSLKGYMLKEKINPEANGQDTKLNTLLTQKSNNKLTNDESSFNNIITDEIKKIRINNTFTTASKEYKEKFLNNWNFVLEKLSNNSDYVLIAGILTDVNVLVVGEKNVIFLAQYDSLLDRLNTNILLIEKLLFEVFGIAYKAVFLLKDEWEYEREKYITNMKLAYKYVYIEEEKASIELNNKPSDILSVLGEEVIKYE